MIRLLRFFEQRFEVTVVNDWNKFIETIDSTTNRSNVNSENIIVPIMYLSEWKERQRSERGIYFQCICRGIPRIQIITHKGNLARILNQHFENCKDQSILRQYYPQTWLLPNDMEKLMSYYCSMQDKDNNETNNNNNCHFKMICKPTGSAKGNGIILIRNINEIKELLSSPNKILKMKNGLPSQYIVQKYINNPLLILNHKFDLRLYLLIASIKPLQVYIHKHGLVRFASQPYFVETDNKNDSNDINTLCGHLTNYTLNKKHPNFKKKDGNRNNSMDQFKWSLQQFWDHIETISQQSQNNESKSEEIKTNENENEKGKKANKDINLKEHIWAQIHTIVKEMFLVQQDNLIEGFNSHFGLSNPLLHNGRCFDILGFDILIDDNYKAWIMEFNRYPSLKYETEIDKTVKYQLISDVFEMIKPRLICNNKDNLLHKHKPCVKLNSQGTNFEVVIDNTQKIAA